MALMSSRKGMMKSTHAVVESAVAAAGLRVKMVSVVVPSVAVTTTAVTAGEVPVPL